MPLGSPLVVGRGLAAMLTPLSASLWGCQLLLSLSLPWTAYAMRADYLAGLRMETVDMFYHGYNNYMQHAFPEDELRPLTCSPLSRDRDNPGHIGINDALGNYSLTLIDSLSTLAILAGAPADEVNTGQQALGDFQKGVAQFVSHYGDGRSGPTGKGTRARGFDLDSKVQVFETVIRGVGGLLSAHLFAIGELPIVGYEPERSAAWETDHPLELPPVRWASGFSYDGQLLRLALDLAQRLLPAFYTDTGIPYPRVNLRHGIPFYVNSPLHRMVENGSEGVEESREITETCSAGAGSLTLEFTVLSRLTGDVRFEQAAKRAFWEVWGRRSEIGLIGNGIDAERGMWIGPHAGIGAGMDSFFEYALKSHILLSGQDVPNVTAAMPPRPKPTDWLDPNTLHAPLAPDLHTSDAFLEAWHQAHASVKRYLYTDRSAYPYYANTHRSTGQPYTMWIDSLGAFYPGLLALAGEVEEAIEANLVYTALWTRYAAIPERWSFRESNVEGGLGWWPGRPEFIESTYYIYRATKDPWYLHVGEMVLRDIKWRCYTPCGWAGLQDVRTGEKQDRMESFFLGETTKYMYLLFDPDHQLNKLDAPFVFTTEGHPLIIPKRRSSSRRQYGRAAAAAAEGSRARESADNTSRHAFVDDDFTLSCPAPAVGHELGVSATASRPDLFAVSRFTDLHNTPNIHGPLEAVEVDDRKKGRVTRYRPLSNYTVFPWTLPTVLLPRNGTCVAPADRVLSWVEFPAGDTLGSVVSLFASATLSWADNRGPTVRALEGLRLQLERVDGSGGGSGGSGKSEEYEDEDEGGDGAMGPVWRITQVGATQLSRHDSVFFHAEKVRHLKDDAFTVVRRADVVAIELIVDQAENEQRNKTRARRQQQAMSNSINNDAASPSGASSSGEGGSIVIDPPASAPSKSLLKSILRAVTSVFEPAFTDLPLPSDDPALTPAVHSWLAYTATGPGSFPVPPVVDTPLPGGPSYNARRPVSNFPWTSVYLAGRACDGVLPDSAPNEHQVIVMRRGGCSFSAKVANIPGFSPSPTALQMVVVVDDQEDEDNVNPIRPFLGIEQVTPKGMRRLHGVPLVLLTIEPGEYELFAQATAVGMRRKYDIYSQGLLVENAIVL